MSNRLLGVLWLLAACGPAPSHEPRLNFDYFISAALKDKIARLQVALISNGRSLDCLKVQESCVVNQVTRDRFLKVQDAMGVERLALTFDLALKSGAMLLDGGSTSTQDVKVQGIPLGKDYALVIEALSTDAPPRLAGSSCNYLEPITAGTNPTKLAIVIKPPIDGGTVSLCDPRIEK